MAKYTNVKTLKKATPTIRTSDNVVKKWDIEVIYTEPTSGWNRAYPHSDEVEYLNKTAEQFTKEDLIALMPPVMEDVFSSHYETFNTPATEERVSNFNLNDLASSK